jgi:hypothetical protein
MKFSSMLEAVVVLAPALAGAQASAINQTPTYFEFQVEKPATMLGGGPKPAYPRELERSGLGGEVQAQFVVMRSGNVDMDSFKVLKSTNGFFTQAVRNWMSKIQFSPAMIGGKPVNQLVQQSFQFAVPRLATVSTPAPNGQDTPSAANASTPDKRDFAFWREMPEVTQVIKDVQGKDDEETAAQRLVAYHLLDRLVNANADRIGELPWRPRESALHSAYTALIWKHTSITARDKRIFDQAERFAADRAFTRPLLKRYFSQAALREIEPFVSGIETNAQANIAQRANETPPVFPGATQAAQAATQPWRSPPGKPNDRVAADFVRAKIESYWVKNADGWTTKLHPTTYGGVVDRSAPEYKQYRNLEFRIEQQALSEAQRLNGIEYRGRAVFQQAPVRFFRSVRDYNAPKGWSDWEDELIFPIAVERRNGEWLIEDAQLFKGLKPGTTTVPPRP